MASFALSVNGKKVTVEAEPDMPLLWVLRDLIQLHGTKYGCGVGVCGACVVHLDDDPVRSCMVGVQAVGNRKITTIEGLSTDGSHPVQKAWIAENVPQCGYCQPGQIMEAAALLKKTPRPSRDEIREAMAEHYCRCGTYPRILKAIERAAGVKK
ncbi:MAG TPA: (2Fe-2S)-binding protein [Fimbriimonadaceae bacterium]|nr:(2Fe-2S)-binding protein [Fimbriimonadaceae bacterium]